MFLLGQQRNHWPSSWLTLNDIGRSWCLPLGKAARLRCFENVTLDGVADCACALLISGLRARAVALVNSRVLVLMAVKAVEDIKKRSKDGGYNTNYSTQRVDV